MRKILQMGAILCGVFFAQTAFAIDGLTDAAMNAPSAAAQTASDAVDSTMPDRSIGRSSGPSRYNQSSSSGYYRYDRYDGYRGPYDQYSPGIYDASGQAGGAVAGSDTQGYAVNADGSCDTPCPPDRACNDCWCLYCHYEPCYYNTWRCCEYPEYYTEKCCRSVPKYYEVQKCKMVPQYYTETCCRYEPEYYDVQKCKTCKKWVCDRHCKYVCKYYYKHVCGNEGCTTPCPQQCPQQPQQ